MHVMYVCDLQRVGNLVLLFDHLSLQIAGRYIPAMAVNRRYITPEVGWLVGLRGGKVGSRTLGGGRTICASVRGRASGSRAAPPPKE